MEEAEVPLEHLHEEVQHTGEHSGEKWISWVALSTAILAVLAAIAGLSVVSLVFGIAGCVFLAPGFGH